MWVGIMMSKFDIIRELDSINDVLDYLCKVDPVFIHNTTVFELYQANENLIDRICFIESDELVSENRVCAMDRAVQIRVKLSYLLERCQ